MEKGVEKKSETENYHAVLAKSYMVYFLAAGIGICSDLFLPLRLHIPHGFLVAGICFVVGAFLIIWAQYTSRHAQKDGEYYFVQGPYRIVRNPTQLGIVLLVAGYTCIMQSVTFLITVIIAYFISNIFFKRYEKILRQTHGEKYIEYQNSVNKIL